MIKSGYIKAPIQYVAYADKATQEEAERFTEGAVQSGLLLFIPCGSSSVKAIMGVVFDADE